MPEMRLPGCLPRPGCEARGRAAPFSPAELGWQNGPTQLGKFPKKRNEGGPPCPRTTFDESSRMDAPVFNERTTALEIQEKQAVKPPWQTPAIVRVANMHDVVRGGGGKLSRRGGDPGEPRKEKPH
jgi:hypothetical protein